MDDSQYDPVPTERRPLATASENKQVSRCQTCDSPHPHLHPAVQFEGEVEVCRDAFHLRITPQNRLLDIQRRHGLSAAAVMGAQPPAADAVAKGERP